MSGLNDGVFDLEVLGPDIPDEEHAWDHIKLDYKKIKGLNSSSLAKAMLRHLKDSKNHEMLIIDWPLIPTLGKYAEKYNIPWVCLDRSPPADAGIFGKLQWFFWRKAWKIVSHSLQHGGACLGGTVVSEAHQRFVCTRFNISDSSLCILNAGFNRKNFQFKERISDAKKEVHLVYHCLLYTSPSPRD